MSEVQVLIVDDEAVVGIFLYRLLQKKGYAVNVALTGSEAEKIIQETRFNTALVDLNLPDTDGLTLLRTIKDLQPSCEVIVMTGKGTARSAVMAIQYGAYDYLEKPFGDIDRVERLIENAVTCGKNFSRDPAAGAEWVPIAEKTGFLVGQSPAMRRLVDVAYKIAKKNINVLIQGDTGTGKEVLAGFIHAASSRSRHVFIPVNCGALPKSLMESELFGHEKGAFTDATNRRRGIFELANHGTLFLDEIGEASLAIQVKLLRVLETGEFLRVGGEKSILADVRLITATNVDLGQALRNKTFREDLFYRLEGIRLEIPPLLDRPEDIPLLAQYFVRKTKSNLRISSAAMRYLCDYSWPGNVRELSNSIFQAMALCDDHVILPEHLGTKIVSGGPVRINTERASGIAVKDPVLAHGAGGSCSSLPFSIKGLHNFLDHYSSTHTALEGVGHEELADLLKLARRLKERILFKMRGKGRGLAPLPTLEEVEMSAIADALDYHQGKITDAARSLGIGRNTLTRKIKAYQLKGEKGQ